MHHTFPQIKFPSTTSVIAATTRYYKQHTSTHFGCRLNSQTYQLRRPRSSGVRLLPPSGFGDSICVKGWKCTTACHFGRQRIKALLRRGARSAVRTSVQQRALINLGGNPRPELRPRSPLAATPHRLSRHYYYYDWKPGRKEHPCPLLGSHQGLEGVHPGLLFQDGQQ